jgi:hypothetical protein
MRILLVLLGVTIAVYLDHEIIEHISSPYDWFSVFVLSCGEIWTMLKFLSSDSDK